MTNYKQEVETLKKGEEKMNLRYTGKKHTLKTKRVTSEKAKLRKGIKAPNWQGGRRISKDGYILIYSPNHPNKNKLNCVCEHKLVMESHIGRTLTKDEVVHHINGNEQDNRIENLQLYASKGIHTRECHTKRNNGRFSK